MHEKYANANTFSYCCMFISYCSRMYCSSMWLDSTVMSMGKMKIANNNVLKRILLDLSKYRNASEMFVKPRHFII